jgi:hypothetical protein
VAARGDPANGVDRERGVSAAADHHRTAALDAGATLTRGQKRLRHRAAVLFVSRVWHERDAFVSDRDKPAAWNLGSADPIVKHLQFETFRGHLLEDKDFGLEFCHAIP